MRVLQVTGLSGLLTICRMLCALVVSKVVAVYGGPSGVALLGQLQSFAATASGVTAAPVGTGIVRHTAERHAEGYAACAPWWRAGLQMMAVLLLLVVPTLCLAAVPIASWLLGSSAYAWQVMLVSISLPFSVTSTLLQSVLNGQQDYRRYLWCGLLNMLLSSAVMVLLVQFSGTRGALEAVSAAAVTSGCITLACVARQPWFRTRFWLGPLEKQRLRGLLHYLAMGIAGTVSLPLSLIVVRDLLVQHGSWSSAGQWQAVWKISEVYLTTITGALSVYYLPRMSALQDAQALLREMWKTARVVIPLVSVLALLVYGLRDVIIALLFSSAFVPARDLFFWQLCADVIKVASWLVAMPMVSKGKSRWFVATELAFCICFTGTCWLLIPLYGAQGANIAYLISYLAYFSLVAGNLNAIVR